MKKIKCEICGKEYKTQKGLDAHVENKHTKDLKDIVVEEETKDSIELSEDDKILLDFFANFNPDSIFINKNQAKIIEPIYKKYGKVRQSESANCYIRMYKFLYYKSLEIGK